MKRRAIPAFVVVLLGLVGLVVVGRGTPAPETPFFASTAEAWMPAAGVSGSLTGSWFCPGVPADGAEGVGGSVVVSNDEGSPMIGRYLVLTEEGVVADETLEVDAWTQKTIDIDALTTASFASVVVEIEGGAGLVEQRAEHPLGDSVAACSNDTSETWYVADGFTLEDSDYTLILTNPFDEPVVADLRFSTETRESQPGEFSGFTVPARSVRTIDVADLSARDEPIISASIEASAGRLVVGRAQEYQAEGRLGYDVSLAAPALRDQWWFADGEEGDGIEETYSIYNPTEDEVEVTVFFGGLPIESAQVNEGDPIVVPPLRSVIFDPSIDRDAPPDPDGGGEDASTTTDTAVEDTVVDDTVVDDTVVDDTVVELQPSSTALPEGRHATVFSTLAQPSIVVERVITRPTDESISTTAVLGATNGPDGLVANTWRMGIGPTEPTEDALVIWNIDQVESAITVSVVGPDGLSAVPSLTDVTLPAASIITIDLVDPDVLGRELIVVSSSRVFVERSLPRGGDLLGRSSSWLLPQPG